MYQVFPGCTPQSASSTQPTNFHALNALQAHSCGTRQWYKSGVGCFAVDPSCNGFDQHSGRCTSCDDPTIQPDNGVCSSPSSTPAPCGSGLHRVNNNCVPLACAAADSNGQCSSCASVLYQVIAGVCVEKNCPLGKTLNSQTGNCDSPCSAGQQFIRGACHTVPSGCAGLT